MMDAYIIDRIHQKKEKEQRHQPCIEIRHYHPNKDEFNTPEKKQERGVEVIDFTI